MNGPIIDGNRWITERMAFLRGLLDGDVTDEARQRIEAEIEALSTEGGLSCRGQTVRRLLPGRRRDAGSGDSH